MIQAGQPAPLAADFTEAAKRSLCSASMEAGHVPHPYSAEGVAVAAADFSTAAAGPLHGSRFCIHSVTR